MKRFACIVGARPNFMKMAPILHAFKKYEDAQPVLIHTGQHYDKNLSDVFFDELNIRKPDLFLGVGSGTHAEQTAKVMVALEKVFMEAAANLKPFHRLVVVGDVNSTLAATLAAAKLQIPVAHVEAGLRSFDRSMPEEVNRIVTDSLSDLLLVSEPQGVANLKAEGQPDSKIRLVGNVMIDTLLAQVEKARQRSILSDLGLRSGEYCVVTLHRPSNVDQQESLQSLVDVLRRVSEALPVVFPIHPRTRERLQGFGLLEPLESAPHVVLQEPLGYNDFLSLTSQARVIVTDSGGLQEESTALLIPCLTMRENTERPITVTEGTSTLCGSSAAVLEQYLEQVIQGTYKHGQCPALWDGHAAERIVEALL
ncbi:MAG: UDP-N-acetylglucosamine 2-epimerase (non-hydrolyzing) [Planctomycetaceae bacterium]